MKELLLSERVPITPRGHVNPATRYYARGYLCVHVHYGLETR